MKVSHVILVGSTALLLGAEPQRFDIPAQLNLADALALSVQPNHPKHTESVLPRQNTKPALTGADEFSLDGFRTSLRSLGGSRTGFQTAQEVLQMARKQPNEEPDAITRWADENTWLRIGWSGLWRNWAIATILGDARQATQYRLEAEKVYAAMTDLEFLNTKVPFRLYEMDPWTMLKLEGSTLIASSLLDTQALRIGEDAAMIPAVADPENYIRQRLRFLRDELISSAKMIRNIGRYSSGLF